MSPILQVLQVILFSVPVLALLGIGVLILVRTVSIVDRLWFLVVFIPLLLANTVVIFAGSSPSVSAWRIWLTLVADVLLIAAAVWVTHGFQVYGLTVEAVETILEGDLRQRGYTVNLLSTEKQDLWGRTKQATLLIVETTGLSQRYWITARFNEVLIKAERRADTALIRPSLPALREEEVLYHFKAHAVGVLYIVLAFVVAVLGWIFFFEPRFILIE